MTDFRRATTTCLTVVLLALGVWVLSPASTTARPAPRLLAAEHHAVDGPAPADLTGLVPYTNRVLVLRTAAWNLELARQAQETAAVARKRTSVNTSVNTSGGGQVTGSCAAMAPPGFPSYIIMRESRGVATADNGSHYGCVQLDYSYLTGNYAADWARLWNNGAGACNWNPPRYCAG